VGAGGAHPPLGAALSPYFEVFFFDSVGLHPPSVDLHPLHPPEQNPGSAPDKRNLLDKY
jgi:hypothetical protein